MKTLQPFPQLLSPRIRMVLAIVAVTGLLGPNGWFLWKVATEFSVVQATLNDPIALVFIGEAFALMLLYAALIRAMRQRPGALVFLAMSLSWAD